MLSDTSCTVSTIRAILVPFHGILYCYDTASYFLPRLIYKEKLQS